MISTDVATVVKSEEQNGSNKSNVEENNQLSSFADESSRPVEQHQQPYGSLLGWIEWLVETRKALEQLRKSRIMLEFDISQQEYSESVSDVYSLIIVDSNSKLDKKTQSSLNETKLLRIKTYVDEMSGIPFESLNESLNESVSLEYILSDSSEVVLRRTKLSDESDNRYEAYPSIPDLSLLKEDVAENSTPLVDLHDLVNPVDINPLRRTGLSVDTIEEPFSLKWSESSRSAVPSDANAGEGVTDERRRPIKTEKHVQFLEANEQNLLKRALLPSANRIRNKRRRIDVSPSKALTNDVYDIDNVSNDENAVVEHFVPKKQSTPKVQKCVGQINTEKCEAKIVENETNVTEPLTSSIEEGIQMVIDNIRRSFEKAKKRRKSKNSIKGLQKKLRHISKSIKTIQQEIRQLTCTVLQNSNRTSDKPRSVDKSVQAGCSTSSECTIRPMQRVNNQQEHKAVQVENNPTVETATNTSVGQSPNCNISGRKGARQKQTSKERKPKSKRDGTAKTTIRPSRTTVNRKGRKNGSDCTEETAGQLTITQCLQDEVVNSPDPEPESTPTGTTNTGGYVIPVAIEPALIKSCYRSRTQTTPATSKVSSFKSQITQDYMKTDTQDQHAITSKLDQFHFDSNPSSDDLKSLLQSNSVGPINDPSVYIEDHVNYIGRMMVRADGTLSLYDNAVRYSKPDLWRPYEDRMMAPSVDSGRSSDDILRDYLPFCSTAKRSQKIINLSCSCSPIVQSDSEGNVIL